MQLAAAWLALAALVGPGHAAPRRGADPRVMAYAACQEECMPDCRFPLIGVATCSKVCHASCILAGVPVFAPKARPKRTADVDICPPQSRTRT
ncbi:hypothetical protein M885DRAFT_522395, partial [Pelagophyceae sp. CCMP2097]